MLLYGNNCSLFRYVSIQHIILCGQNIEFLHVKLVVHNVITGLYSDSLHPAYCSIQAASVFLTDILRYMRNLTL